MEVPDDSRGAASYTSRVTRLAYRLGLWCARHPFITLALALVMTGACGAGISTIVIEETPERLWVAPDAVTERQKAAFDAHFGRFYRVSQAIVLPKVRCASSHACPLPCSCSADTRETGMARTRTDV